MHSATTASQEAPFPRYVGPYELVLPIATGGMAMVYLARRHGLGGFERSVALKLMHPHLRDQPEWTQSFVDEAKLAGAIHHPNVVQVLDVGDDLAGTYLVMEYVEGDSLAGLDRSAKTRGVRMPRAVALRILCDALRGLHVAHEQRDARGFSLGLVHRDFSPQNILVGLDGVVRLADFGIAKTTQRETRTRTGTIKGKVGYMAPEQVRGERLDRRCDVWAAGVVAWELLAGRRLHPPGDDIPTALRITREAPERLSEVASDVPRELEEVVAWALTPRMEARCPTAELLRERLERAATVADSAEVAAFVDAFVAHKLELRRARITELRAQSDPPAASTDVPTELSAHVRRSRARNWRTWGKLGLAGVLVFASGTAVSAALVERHVPSASLPVAAEAPRATLDTSAVPGPAPALTDSAAPSNPPASSIVVLPPKPRHPRAHPPASAATQSKPDSTPGPRRLAGDPYAP